VLCNRNYYGEKQVQIPTMISKTRSSREGKKIHGAPLLLVLYSRGLGQFSSPLHSTGNKEIKQWCITTNKGTGLAAVAEMMHLTETSTEIARRVPPAASKTVRRRFLTLPWRKLVFKDTSILMSLGSFVYNVG
jgi:hypothetical protein